MGVSPRAAALAALALLVCFAAGNGLATGAQAGPAAAHAAAPAPSPFVSLAGESVNARRGPGLEHRIEWTYQRRGLPLEVVGESGNWRRVRDPDGAETWISADFLSPTRTAYVLDSGLGTLTLRQRPEQTARVAGYLGRGVVARIEGCSGSWRLVAIDEVEGWAPAEALWAAGGCAAQHPA
ncbi:MAG: aspartyl-trna synthetase [Alphaproteobacteria bacterium]|nr:aspartyl-trna synthetase [Alphaproteobacteria bacterium]